MTEGGEDLKYGVWISPTGDAPVEPGKEVNIDTSFGKVRAEHVFKFRRIK